MYSDSIQDFDGEDSTAFKKKVLMEGLESPDLVDLLPQHFTEEETNIRSTYSVTPR